MFIRTQDKEMLLQFDKIYIDNDELRISYFGEVTIAGRYKDLNECKQVLNAIHVCILAHTQVYQMPSMADIEGASWK